MKQYAIVIEKGTSNYSAYVPDLPGCVATGATVGETEYSCARQSNCIWTGLREDGLPIPPPTSVVEYVQVLA